MLKAGEGNRTLVSSLEGYGSTIELRPRSPNGQVVEHGFEPWKALLADLQSAPFGHSGIPPFFVKKLEVGLEPTTC